MSKKVFVTRRIPEAGLSLLRDKGYEIDIYKKDRIMSQKELVGALKKTPYDAVVSLLTDRIDGAVFAISPSVKIFANYATGFDNIDLVEAKRRGVAVTNAPSDIASEAVAEHAVALMFALAARIVEADSFVRAGKYKGWEPMLFTGEDVSGKTLGIVGAGRIGAKVSCHAQAMGINVIYFDVKRNQDFEKGSGAVYCSSIEELLSKSDFVSLHVPLLDSTRHLINADRLRLMKPTSFLINTSRGPVIDEKALVKALKERVIAGAGLDVFEFEPKLSLGLSKLPNVILTPHIASASVEARNQMAEIVAGNIIDFFDGRRPKNILT